MWFILRPKRVATCHYCHVPEMIYYLKRKNEGENKANNVQLKVN